MLDKLRYPAMETSYANGGQLSASNAEVWNTWPTVLKGLRWMSRRDAPLLLNPKPSWRKYQWLAEFCLQIPHHKLNTIATTRLAIDARVHLFEVASKEGIDFDLQKKGLLHIYYDAPSFRRASSGNELLLQGGLDRHPVTPEEIRPIEPAWCGQFYGGFYTPSDCSGDIHKFTRGLPAACERKDARFVQGADVRTINTRADVVSIQLDGDGVNPTVGADAVMICAGAASRNLAAKLGDWVNIYPVKGYSITVNLPDAASQKATPWVSLLDEEAKIVTSRLGEDRFRIAGTAEFNGENKDIRSDRVQPLVRWCERLFPDVSTASVTPWAGLRPMTPSMLPRVSPGRHKRVFYNTGHGHLGWTLSAATAQLAAEAVDQAQEGWSQ